MPTHTNDKVSLWKQQHQEYRASGLSRKAFAEQLGVKLSTVDYWFGRLSKEAQKTGLVEIKPNRLPATGTPIQMVVAGRYRLEIGNECTPQLLSTVLSVLEARP